MNVPMMLIMSAIAGLFASPVTGDINALISATSEDTVSTEGLAKYVSDKEDIKIANYKDRTGIKADLRPYEAFMMRIR